MTLYISSDVPIKAHLRVYDDTFSLFNFDEGLCCKDRQLLSSQLKGAYYIYNIP